VVDRGTRQRDGSCRCKGLQRVQSMSQGSPTQLRPDPVTPHAVFLVKLQNALASGGDGEPGQIMQSFTELCFLGVIILRPGFDRALFQQISALGLGSLQEGHKARITPWGLGETIPSSLPRWLGMSPQPLGTFEFTVLLRVEPVLGLTSAAEGLPPRRFPPL